LASDDPLDELLNITELCAMLKITKGTAYRQRTTGTGPPCSRVGKHLRFRRGDVLAWLEAKKKTA
jgi:excisionase family DNA binding protein